MGTAFLTASLAAVVALAPVAGGSVAQAADAPAQVITVRTTSPSATSGVVEAWKRRPDGSYRRVLGPITAYVGSEGVGRASEYRSRTPKGVFTVTEAFGRLPDPGAHLPYRQVTSNDWWVSDVNSRYYNTLQTCSAGACPFSTGASEHLSTISVYDYALVIDYNRDPVVAGAGSAFFLHISAGAPTAGCVSMPKRVVKKLLRWLKPSRDPVISIGVGNAAYAPVS